MTLLVTRAHIENILSDHRQELMDLLVRNVEAGYHEMAKGTETEHPRIYLRSKTDPQRRPPGLFSMSSLLQDAGLMTTRLLALGGVNPNDGDGMLILFDQRKKTCLAIIWDLGIHNYRTGAPAAVAAKRMANPASRVIGVVGSSGIAEGTLSLVHHVLPSVSEVRVFSPTPANRERFAGKMRPLLGCEVTTVDTVDAAVRGADIVVTATDADRAVVPDEALTDGVFIAAMARNEVSGATLRRCKNVLASRESWAALDPPLHEPFPEETIVGDLASVIAGTTPIGYDPKAISVFSGGAPVAMWDVAASSAVYELCTKQGLGAQISLYE